jgi:DNA-binding SARP family transcriptional activator
MVAAAVVDQLPSLDPAALNIVEAEVLRRPERWRPPLRGALSRRAPSASTAARLLDKVGEQDDVAILRSFARENRKAGIDPEIGRGLARRLAPRVVIEDLGRIRILIGDTEVTASSVRKKSLALLCYLLTRPRWSSTKEQVLEALWPDAEPEVGANSLNQTLYFLRRVFDPAYKEDVSADYVHYEQDVVWLDSELLASRSSRAARALENASRRHAAEDLERLVSEYTAQFALDFAYEDWALGFRDSLHIRFLEVVERSLAVDASAGHFDRAIWLARKALDVDPDADQLEALLVRLYRLSKAYVAAAEQYAHYTRTLKTTLGIEPPPLESV